MTMHAFGPFTWLGMAAVDALPCLLICLMRRMEHPLCFWSEIINHLTVDTFVLLIVIVGIAIITDLHYGSVFVVKGEMMLVADRKEGRAR